MIFFAAFGQHVDASGQMNFAGADMAGSSYLPGEAVFLPASMASSEAPPGTESFSQPDLPPATVAPATLTPGTPAAATSVTSDPAALSKKGTAKSKTSGKKAKQHVTTSTTTTTTSSGTTAGPPPPAAAVAAAPAQPDDPAGLAALSVPAINPGNIQIQPYVDPNQLQEAFETYEAYTAAMASAVVDLDSETDSNHDTALTLACAGGHEELVTLLINRGANIGTLDEQGSNFFLITNFSRTP